MNGTTVNQLAVPMLLFDGECGVCRRIGHWVQQSAHRGSSETLFARPIGDDPDELLSLNPNLDIWDAYANIHVLMPDGSMKVGGEAVAEVLRDLPSTRWFAWSFGVNFLGIRPFQWGLNLGYLILSDIRPLFGCESCGAPSSWVKPIRWIVKHYKSVFGGTRGSNARPHFTSNPPKESTATGSSRG